MEAAVFIGAIIAGITQVVKLLSPKVAGIITVVVAILAGIIVAVVDTSIGVQDITIAQGIYISLGTIGAFAAIDRVK